MKKLVLFLALGLFTVVGLSSFQSFNSKQTVQSKATTVITVIVSVDGYFGELYFNDATDQFISGQLTKEIPFSGGLYKVGTITSVNGYLSRDLLSGHVTHFDGTVAGYAVYDSTTFDLSLNYGNNAAVY
jgi:hypothetical protein